jgi:FtsH-binding integral membrane protein
MCTKNRAFITFGVVLFSIVSAFGQAAPPRQMYGQPPSNPIEQLFNLIYWSSIAQIATAIICLVILICSLAILRRLNRIAEDMRKRNDSI